MKEEKKGFWFGEPPKKEEKSKNIFDLGLDDLYVIRKVPDNEE